MVHPIKIQTRYGNKSHIQEMQDFVECLLKSNLSNCVDSLFYDSKTDTCDINLNPNLGVDCDSQKILDCATRTLGQFNLNGTHHVNKSLCPDQDEYAKLDEEEAECLTCLGSGVDQEADICKYCGGTGRIKFST